MGKVRGWKFGAVIGIGGIGAEPKRYGIAGKLTWIGIGPRKSYDLDNPNSPRVRFDNFWYRGQGGPLLEESYPSLARRMFDRNVRVHMHCAPETPELDREVEKILRLAMAAPPSAELPDLDFQDSPHKCEAISGVGRTAHGLPVTSAPKVTLRKFFNFNVLNA
jgi:hypothetical protein